MSLYPIEKLPEDIINQIKAGEVVERPSSVVKELVENAIDAKATSLHVELLDGGKQLIKITDNGSGIAEDDLPIALERHATSKLRNMADLEKILSFGFRGEALPSIASVCEMTIRSRIQGAELGTEITVSQGKILSKNKVSMATGTVIQVKDLFCHVPARLKFLKSTTTEYTHIHDFLVSMSFLYHQISFKLTHNGREVFSYKAREDSKQRFAEIVGLQSENYAQIHYQRGSFSIEGFSLLPEKASSLAQYFVMFINGRLVKDRIIRSGIMQAYQGLLLKGLVPSSVISISVDPSWLDVNVHPSKIEVRFTDPGAVQELIAIGLQNVLKKTIHRSIENTQINSSKQNENFVTNYGKQNENFHSKSEFVTAKTEESPLAHKNKDNLQFNPMGNFRSISEPKPRPHLSNLKAQPSIFQDTAPPIEQNLSSMPEPVLSTPKNSASSTTTHVTTTSIFSQAKYLGQFSNCYLLLEIEKELWIVDQHAFHERILYEEFIRNYEKTPLMKQGLLTPYIISSTTVISAIALEETETIHKLGFDFEILKDSNIAIHAYPSMLSPSKISVTFDEILGKLLAIKGIPSGDTHPVIEKAKNLASNKDVIHVRNTQLEPTEFYHLFYATLACHSAVRSGDSLNEELVRRLLERSRDVDFYAHCPHGRPVIRKFSLKDVESWFLRI